MSTLPLLFNALMCVVSGLICSIAELKGSFIKPMFSAWFNALGLVAWFLLAAGCASLPDKTDQTASYTIEAQPDTRLANIIDPSLKQHPKQNAMHLLEDNLDAFAARLIMLEKADVSIDAQYYEIEPGQVGQLFLHYLLRAADRGVRVRLLLDDNKTAGRDALFAALSAHPNMNVWVYNPFSNRRLTKLGSLTEFKRVDRRMHNKSLIVDDTLAIVGGRNIGNKYFAAESKLEFRDLDILLAGDIVGQTAEQFDIYWNAPQVYDYKDLYTKTDANSLADVRKELAQYAVSQRNSAYIQHVFKSNLVTNLLDGRVEPNWGQASLYYDLPQKSLTDRSDKRYWLGPQVRAIADRAEQEILIISPYFIPQDWGEQAFKQWIDQGVKVSVLTNSLASNNLQVVHTGYAKYRKQLLELGVNIYELKPNVAYETEHTVSGLHAKSFVFDRKQLFVGSMNLDPRSVVLNTEMGVAVDNDVIAGRVAHWFTTRVPKIAYQVNLTPDGQLQWVEQTKDGKTQIHAKEPETSVLQRSTINVLKTLPIEGEL